MSRKSQEKYRLAGLCIFCGKVEPNEGKQGCELCLQRNRLATKRRRNKLLAAGKCTRCGVGKLVNKRYCFGCYEDHKKSARQSYSILKDEVFESYGGYVCTCCGEKERAFLTIDHINGNGCKHRREIGQSNVYRWLKENNYPSGFQILCMNCQWGKKNCNGICPHKRICHQ